MSDESSSDDPAAESVAAEVRERIESDPYCATLGIELRDLGPGSATTALTVTDDLVNFHGTPHGGAIYSLADAAFAAASNSHGETAVALETNISYLAAVDVGTTVLATATETHLTRRTGEYEVVLTTEDDGERLATFRGRVYRP
jgi:acyl-CoA thioesterase